MSYLIIGGSSGIKENDKEMLNSTIGPYLLSFKCFNVISYILLQGIIITEE